METQRIAFCADTPVPDHSASTPPCGFLLIRYGKNRYTKGGGEGEFEFGEAEANRVLNDFAARGRDLVIDYEHQSLGGGKAPAAGWIDKLEKTAAGLTAHVKYWTEEATAYLKNGEYRYFSPALYFSRSGKNVSAIHSVALTNHPALHSIPALAADDAADDERPARSEAESLSAEIPGETLEKLLKLMDLSPEKGEEAGQKLHDLIERVSLQKEQLVKLSDFLAAHGFSDLNDAEGSLSLRIPRGSP